MLDNTILFMYNEWMKKLINTETVIWILLVIALVGFCVQIYAATPETNVSRAVVAVVD